MGGKLREWVESDVTYPMIKVNCCIGLVFCSSSFTKIQLFNIERVLCVSSLCLKLIIHDSLYT